MKKSIPGFLLFVLSIFICSAKAQISSPAFEDGCYLPQIGNGIDTIMGHYEGQNLGASLHNLGPWININGYGSIATLGLPKYQTEYATFQAGPNFDLHHLQSVAKFDLDLSNLPKSWYHFGHFHNQKNWDLAIFGESFDTIYWSDDVGRYSTTRFSTLRSSVVYDPKMYYTYGYLVKPYATYLCSDTVEDILLVGSTATLDGRDSLYLYLYKGGQSLYKQGDVYPDSIFNLLHGGGRSGVYADFRGTGRIDAFMVNANDSDNSFFFRNDPPFSMSKFAQAFLYDTVFTGRENSQIVPGRFTSFFTMGVMPKNSGDHSIDLLMTTQTTNLKTTTGLWIFRGGPDFGLKRLYLDTPDFFINPGATSSYFRNALLFLNVIDYGDITGSGNHVLGASGYDPVAEVDMEAAFVTGNAINDKIDMYFEGNERSDAIIPDTITADGDKLQDIVFGNQNAGLSRGSIGIIHGTNKIPVHLNEVFSQEQRNGINNAPGHIYAYPNPCDRKTVLAFDNCTSSVMRVEVCTMLGEIVKRDETPAVDGLQAYAVDLSELPSGMYSIRLTCPAQGWTGSVNVVKIGDVQAPWKLDLHKMMGK